jgi:hypothetical protein
MVQLDDRTVDLLVAVAATTGTKYTCSKLLAISPNMPNILTSKTQYLLTLILQMIAETKETTIILLPYIRAEGRLVALMFAQVAVE